MKNARPSAFGTTLLAAGVILLMLASLLLILPIVTCPECNGVKYIGPTITEAGKDYPFPPLARPATRKGPSPISRNGR